MRKFIQYEQKNILHATALCGYPFGVVAKSTAERQNSNSLQGEQHAKRAFFVRSFRLPQKRLERISMVERNGKGSPFAVYLVGQFLTPLRSTAQTVRSLAVVLNNQYKETAKMLFKFLLLGDKRLTVRIRAKSEAEARQRLNLSKSTAICVARLNGGIYA